MAMTHPHVPMDDTTHMVARVDRDRDEVEGATTVTCLQLHTGVTDIFTDIVIFFILFKLLNNTLVSITSCDFHQKAYSNTACKRALKI